MRISINLDTLAVGDSTGSALQTLSTRRSDAFPIRLGFLQGGVGKELPSGAVGRLAIKNTRDYSGVLVAGSPAWRKVGYGSSAYYVFILNLATQQMDEAFFTLSGELAQVSFTMEIEWAYRGVRQTSRPVAFVVDNDYTRSGDVPPTPIAGASGS
jgi:hypothetical protein